PAIPRPEDSITGRPSLPARTRRHGAGSQARSTSWARSPSPPASTSAARSIVAVGVVLLYSGGYWFLSAKNWFKGPKVQGSAKRSRRSRPSLRRSAPNLRPRIGITVHPRRGMQSYVPYRRAVEAAGAEPVDVVPGSKALAEVDGLLLPAGCDVDPFFDGAREEDRVGATCPE